MPTHPVRLGEEVVRLLRENPDLAPSDVVFLANHREGLEAVKVITDAGFKVQHVFGNTSTEKRERKLRFWGSASGVRVARCTASRAGSLERS